MLGRLPTAAWLCALVAALNACAWSLVTPAFQIPDEQSHYAYAEYLAQHGQPPITRDGDGLSTSQTIAMADLAVQQVQFEPANPTIWAPSDETGLRRDLARDASRSDGNGAALEVGGEPPLYYALQAVPYALGSGGTVLDRLALMRLLSALLGGLTALFTYLLLREALPAHALTWTVGALGVALQPLFGFVTAGVNSDALLYAATAALFYLVARILRRGLTRSLAVAIGAVMAVGLMTKFNFAGLMPGAVAALLVAGRRREGRLRWSALGLPTLALGIAVAPVLLEMALNVAIWDRPMIGATAGNFAPEEIHPTLGRTLSYLWQFYLGPLPGMAHYFATSLSLRDFWLNGFVGRLGYVETEFRPWVYDVALVAVLALLALAARAVVVRREALRRRAAELLVFGCLAGGLAAFVALASYIAFLRYGGSVAQARYLVPLVPLYGALLALAARGAGRRWMPVAGTAIVVLALAHNVFSQLLIVERYYT